MKQPSASNAEAFVRCTSSHVLPQHDSYHERTDKGTHGHTLLCAVINRMPGAAGRLEAELPGLHQKLAETMDGVSEAVGEEAYVVDIDKRTSTFVGQDIGREYEKALGRKFTKYEMGASLDARGRRKDMPWIRDFKFGIYSSWWQLYIQSMAILWRKGSADVEVDAGFMHIEDRDDNITVTEDTAVIYLSDLDERADDLMEAYARADGLERQLASGTHYSDLKVVEGKWCQYCGAFPHCPAKWKLAKSMLDLDVVNHIGALTLEQCGAAWLKIGEVKKNLIEKMEDALKVRMEREGGFPLPDGKLLKVLPMPGRKSLDKEALANIFEKYNNLAVEYTKVTGVPLRKEEAESVLKVGDGYGQVRKVNAR